MFFSQTGESTKVSSASTPTTGIAVPLPSAARAGRRSSTGSKPAADVGDFFKNLLESGSGKK